MLAALAVGALDAPLLAAAHAAPVPVDDPVVLEQRTRKVELRALSVLGGWSAVNLVGGTVGYFTAKKPELKGFHLMNAAWNTVNAGLALGGLLGGRNRDVSSLETVQQRRRKLQNTLRVNLALDGVYIASGIATTLIGDHLDKPMVTGSGVSLIVQGGFLTVFDAIFLHAHVQAGSARVQVAMTGNGVLLSGSW